MTFPAGTPRSESLPGAASLAFWLGLFAAAGMYALVALSAKVVTCHRLTCELEANQWRLVTLDREIDRLERVIDAYRTDPAFVREQAESAFDLPRAGEEKLPVDDHLTLSIAPPRATADHSRTAPPAWLPVLHRIAASRTTGNGLLAAAAGLVIAAFTLFPVRSADG